MCLSCVSNESLGERRHRRAYWCAPPSMLWFVPDGCVKYWCDHRALRGYPTCHSITAFRPRQQQLWIAKWPFSYFANMFQLTELQPATKSTSCQTWNCFFFPYVFLPFVWRLWLFLEHPVVGVVEMQRSPVSASLHLNLFHLHPKIWKCNFSCRLRLVFLHIAQYLIINAHMPLDCGSRAISVAKSWVNYVLNFLLAESSVIAAGDSSRR